MASAFYDVFRSSQPLDVRQGAYGTGGAPIHSTVSAIGGGAGLSLAMRAAQQKAAAEAAKALADQQAAELAAKSRAIPQANPIAQVKSNDSLASSTGYALSPTSAYATSANVPVQPLTAEEIQRRNLQATATSRLLVRPQLVAEKSREAFIQREFSQPAPVQPARLQTEAVAQMSYIKQPQSINFSNLLNTPNALGSSPGTFSAQPAPNGRIEQAQQTLSRLMNSDVMPKPGVERVGYELKQAAGEFGLSALSTVKFVKQDLLDKPIGYKANNLINSQGIYDPLGDVKALIKTSQQPHQTIDVLGAIDVLGTKARTQPGRFLGGVLETGAETAAIGIVGKAGFSQLVKVNPYLSSELTGIPKAVEEARQPYAASAVDVSVSRYKQLEGVRPSMNVPFQEVTGLQGFSERVRGIISTDRSIVFGSAAQRAYSPLFPLPGDIDLVTKTPISIAKQSEQAAVQAGVRGLTAVEKPASFRVTVTTGGAGGKAVVTPILQIPFTPVALATSQMPEGALLATKADHVLDIKSPLLTEAFPFSRAPMATPEGVRVVTIGEQEMRKVFGAFSPSQMHRVPKDTASLLTMGVAAGQLAPRTAAEEAVLLAKEYEIGKAQLGFSKAMRLNPEKFGIDDVNTLLKGEKQLEEALNLNLKAQKGLIGDVESVLKRGAIAEEAGSRGALQAKPILETPRDYVPLYSTVGSSYGRIGSGVSVSSIIGSSSIVPSSSFGRSSFTPSSKPSGSSLMPSSGSSSSIIPSIPSLPSLPSPGKGSSIINPPSTPPSVNPPSSPSVYGGYSSVLNPPSVPSMPKLYPSTPIVPNRITDNKKGDKKKRLVTGYISLFKETPYKKNQYRVLDETPLPFESAKFRLESFLIQNIQRSGKLVKTTRLVEEAPSPKQSLDQYFRPSKRNANLIVQKVGILTRSEVGQIQRAKSLTGGSLFSKTKKRR